MGDGRDINIGGREIGESTKITLSVKTALWIIGAAIALFSTIFTYAYFDVKADVEIYKKKLEDSNEEFIKQVEENISIKLDKEQDKDERFIEDIAKIKGDIQLILDRTQRLGGNAPIEGAPTMNNNNPNNTVPRRGH
jgi:hypothetical protein